ncbi:zf-HC2 domain-containing protein [Streptomyces sp. NBC_00237]|uniref:anti-sigma factor family protein n=1 Tax=Streptomyces sp. NBC_00237 TaxID=2975687 RepID=UPI00224D7655|nr:zf-HC2 domain-containing protein [Streptomyces sp. NBC_00237]MCX5204404.1 zf-HC2 domain-containing protein [Streptomyces sp. NBC_00237]
MSGSRPTPAEQHLGDRLAALVDGELGHDSRERVLAHLATCAKCKAEADAQRRLKDVFAHSAPPAPSAGFLARLQGLSDGTDDDDGQGGGPPGRRRFGEGAAFGVFSADQPLGFGSRIGYEPEGAHPGVLPEPSRDRGFRIHEVGRPESERTGRRPRRFAFAAASAVSLAAIALGGALPAETTNNPTARGERAGGFVPTRAATPASGTDSSRRQGGATSVGSGSSFTGAGSATLLSATSGNRAGTAAAPPVPHGTGLAAHPPGAQPNRPQGSLRGQGRWDRGLRVFPVPLTDASYALPLIRQAPTPSPSATPSTPSAPGQLAAPPTPELSVSRSR